MGNIELIDNRACFFRKDGFTEAVELCQRSVYIDVSQTKHNLVQMKTMEYIREVKTLLAYCNRNVVT